MDTTDTIEQILSEAQHRWLRSTEICQILTNYNSFQIASQPSHMPPSIHISFSFYFLINSFLFLYLDIIKGLIIMF